MSLFTQLKARAQARGDQVDRVPVSAPSLPGWQTKLEGNVKTNLSNFEAPKPQAKKPVRSHPTASVAKIACEGLVSKGINSKESPAPKKVIHKTPEDAKLELGPASKLFGGRVPSFAELASLVEREHGRLPTLHPLAAAAVADEEAEVQ